MRNVVRNVLSSLIVASLIAVPLVGCAPAPQRKAVDPRAQHKALVAEADAAWDAGDAETAFNLYNDALRDLPEGEDDAKLREKQERAKNLVLARRILASSEPGPNSIEPCVQVLIYSSQQSTEAAAARAILASTLQPFASEMSKEIAALKKGVSRGDTVELPLTVRLVSKLAVNWEESLSQAPGTAGDHGVAAVKKMKAATVRIQKAFDEKYADAALRHLAQASSELEQARRELALLGTTSE